MLTKVYSEIGLSYSTLEGQDLAVAETLRKIAQKNDKIHLFLASVNYTVSGRWTHQREKIEYTIKGKQKQATIGEILNGSLLRKKILKLK